MASTTTTSGIFGPFWGWFADLCGILFAWKLIETALEKLGFLSPGKSK